MVSHKESRMGREDRRQKVALDESYRYYRFLESKGEPPEMFRLTKCLRTLSTALAFADQGEFKLTRQLWKRLQQALFDRLISGFPGKYALFDNEGEPIRPNQKFPEEGVLSFRPSLCRRAEDMISIEIRRLYPKTHTCLAKAWRQGRTSVAPPDFAESDCEGGLCPMKPVLFGHEVLGEESQAARDRAYRKWWDLYWQAYCTGNKHERELIYRHMSEIESVWGDLYY